MITIGRARAGDARLARLFFGLGLLLVLLAVPSVTMRVSRSAYVADVTDFRRDLIGANAAAHGLSPYQTLGEIARQVPVVDIPDTAKDYWVSHSPASVGFARLLLTLFADRAEEVAKWLFIGSTVLLLLLIGGWAKVPTHFLSVVAGSLLISHAVEDDLMWLQGAGTVGLLLVSIFALARSRHRYLALVILGALVAWRPWVAPVALFLPRSRSPWRDAGLVGACAIGVTAFSLPFTGGMSALGDWLITALRANAADYVSMEWNISLTARLLGPAVSLALLAAVAMMMVPVSKGSRARGAAGSALAIIAFSPLAWPWYWMALSPALAAVRRRPSEAAALSLALLATATPVVFADPMVIRIGSALGLLLLAISLYPFSPAAADQRLKRAGARREDASLRVGSTDASY